MASGNINVTPTAGVGSTTQYGLLAHAGDPTISGVLGAGNASVTYNSGTLNVSAVRPRGILAWVDGIGSATVNTAAGTVINVSGTQFGGPGVYLFSSGTATAPNTLTANVASHITSSGPASTDPCNLPVGIRATNSGTDAPIFVTYTGPGITTVGGNGIGILATSGSGSISEFLRADQHDDGSNAVGISHAAAFETGYGAGQCDQRVHQGRVQHRDQRDSGSGDVTVNIAPGGSVMGGWQADLTSVGVELLRSTGRRRYPELDRRHRDPDQ